MIALVIGCIVGPGLTLAALAIGLCLTRNMPTTRIEGR